MNKALLIINNLTSSTENTAILNSFCLEIQAGSIHAIMGPNGSGKSTLAHTLMGHPAYEASGTVTFNNKNLLEMEAHERAKEGLFLAFQYPLSLEGLPYIDFLRQAYNSLHGGSEKQLGLRAFRTHVEKKAELLGMDTSFLDRHLNVGFSGGEKKRAEILQLAVLMPKLAILDEIDSGLDIDALKSVCSALQKVKESHPEMSLIFITHYQRILNYIRPDIVHIMDKGTIRTSGGFELVEKLEQSGYKTE